MRCSRSAVTVTASRLTVRRPLAVKKFDVLLLEVDHVVAGGWGVPLHWNGSAEDLPDGYDGSLVRSVEAHERSVPVDCLSIMAAAVRADRRGSGLAGQVLTELRRRAMEAGLARVIAPIRPSLVPSSS